MNTKNNVFLIKSELPEDTIARLRDFLTIAEAGECTGVAAVIFQGHGEPPLTIITDSARTNKHQTTGALIELIGEVSAL